MKRIACHVVHKFCWLARAGAGEAVPVKIGDLTTVEGVRENSLIGYGMVVGLTRTGDSQQTVFTTQTLANIMQRMGAQIPPATARVNNVAAVFVTASLPPLPARGGNGCDGLVDRRRKKPRRRNAAADPSVWRRRASICRGARAGGGGRICGGRAGRPSR